MPAMAPTDDVALTVCLYAARMNVGGLFASDGREAAFEVMKKLLQLLTSQGAIINWRALSVGPEYVHVEVYIGPARGYRLELKTECLTPENEPALAVMCS